jgi:hypothetical protein
MSSAISGVIPPQVKTGTTRDAELGFWCSAGAFVTWFGMGVESILRPFQDNRRETFWVLPFLLTFAAFCFLHRVQRGRSRTEAVGFILVIIASVLVLLGNIGLQLNIHTFDAMGFPGGAITWLIGLGCFGIGTIKARVVPPYAGWALILLEPGSILAAMALSPIAPLLERGAYSGNVGKGVAMGIVALGLRAVARREATSQV